ncbi:hypothetical protein E2F46_06240 [Luteimonas aestuarii]|uniref:Antitoxin VbhA domain-containing protein n=1 Tax=Luteimonas aestuarii TaxID=453837 RepID=A0A4R5TY85_9GAMM|nr:hypothetical protein [Luteimonas aestuarii]TDK26194.1 hypothetical protein E2F46_06240 [Luteimonas aestuarii]
MPRLPELTPEDAELERDPTFRREVVENILEGAEERGLLIDRRCRRLLEQYERGTIDCHALYYEIGRPVLH